MIIIKNITLRNFLSVGAVTQAVNFDNKDLTLILGENLDLGGDGARNGTGKTTLIQAVSYAIFGSPINNIRKDNLINRTNGKGMMVTLEFSANGIEYKIERGRRPNILKFYINDDVQESKDDAAQGENKETQGVIEQAMGMTHDMFKHIVVLNTYSLPFLAMPSGEQRKIIEQLLGITLLSEKADAIKEKMRTNKDSIQLEEFKVKAIEEANKRIKEQIDGLRRRQNLWTKQHDESLTRLVSDYEDLIKIDISAELNAHKSLMVYNEKKKKQDVCNSLLARQTAWMQKRDRDLGTKLEAEIKTLEDNRCYACGQDFHDANHTEVLNNKQKLLADALADVTQTQIELEKNKNSLFILGKVPVTHYKTEAEAIKHGSEIENISQKIETKRNESDPYLEQIDEECTNEILGLPPVTHYDTETEAVEHRSTVAALVQQIESKTTEVDPYGDQIVDMEKKAIQEISFDTINELTVLGDHYKFLLDLLTSKDSFVRKRIIDQNLSYLNSRLTYYLDKIGLPHTVVFKNDLSVEITELGRELDFYNLSRGEMNRVILALSWAFRDVWENLYSSINVMFIDELLDNGTDSVGVENSLSVLKHMNRTRSKSIWLISHKEDLCNRVGSVLRVVKEGGFTSYANSSDIE